MILTVISSPSGIRNRNEMPKTNIPRAHWWFLHCLQLRNIYKIRPKFLWSFIICGIKHCTEPEKYKSSWFNSCLKSWLSQIYWLFLSIFSAYFISAFSFSTDFFFLRRGMLRDYSWLWSQKSLLMGSGDHMEYQGRTQVGFVQGLCCAITLTLLQCFLLPMYIFPLVSVLFYPFLIVLFTFDHNHNLFFIWRHHLFLWFSRIAFLNWRSHGPTVGF